MMTSMNLPNTVGPYFELEENQAQQAKNMPETWALTAAPRGMICPPKRKTRELLPPFCGHNSWKHNKLPTHSRAVNYPARREWHAACIPWQTQSETTSYRESSNQV